VVISKRKKDLVVARIRSYSSEKNAERILAYILVGLDKLRKVWYKLYETENQRIYHEVRLLVDVETENGGNLIAAAGDTAMALVPTDSSGHQGACYLQYSGIMLYPNEYSFVIPDEEYEALLRKDT
jgi:hypothetical protein